MTDKPAVELQISQVPGGTKYFWIINRYKDNLMVSSETSKVLYANGDEAQEAVLEHYRAQIASK